MKLMITGSTGFLGTHLLPVLKAQGHELRCLVRETSDLTTVKQVGAEIIVGDLFNIAALREGMLGCDAVIHLANLYSFWESDPSVYDRVNVDGTFNVMLIAAEQQVPQVIHVSSAVVYGKPEASPFNEETPPASTRLSAYAESKYFGEQFVRRFVRDNHLPVVILQPAAIIGAGDIKASGDYVKYVLRGTLPATGMDDSVITFVPARDVVEAMVRVLGRADVIGETFIIGKEAIRLEDYLKMISNVAGKPLPRMRFSNGLILFLARVFTFIASLTKIPPLWGMSVDQARTFMTGFHADGSKAERVLGLSYTPVSDAVRESVAWHRKKA
ncbi:MAG: NAD-dependent epimerase/dehydratase family protein [Anaerolineaceae bacterium]|nr:NAD-dependent epimerase/dehydratase family protein [Anaerolineaceae bacterium]